MQGRGRATSAPPLALAVALATAGVAVAGGGGGTTDRLSAPPSDGVRIRAVVLSRLGRYPSPARIRAEYLWAVQRVVVSGPATGAEAVAALEQAVHDSGGAEGLIALAPAEAEIAARLVAAEPAALLPILRLHSGLFQRYWEAGLGTLANHSTRLLEALVGGAGGELGDPAVRRAAAGILAETAGHLESSGIVLRARRLLEAAQRLDGDAPQVLAAQASLHESLGRYREAVAELGRLLRTDPGNREARLRRGVNRLRLGDVDGATADLERCTAAGGPAWVRAVAYEELARVAVQGGRWADAAAILEQAVAAVDDPESALIQLAYVYDRLGRPADAEALLARGAEPRPERSPRFVYAARPAPFVTVGASAGVSRKRSVAALARGIERLMTPPGEPPRR